MQPFEIFIGNDLKTQITALMPHRNGAAVLHATDIKFDQSPGAMNVFCTSDATDLQRSYPVDFQQTANITTFMQKDIINADLGYMVNGGFSDLMKNWTVEDDQFVVLVEVQLQDTDNTADGTTHDVQLSVKIGNVFVVGKKLLINLRMPRRQIDKLPTCSERNGNRREAGY